MIANHRSVKNKLSYEIKWIDKVGFTWLTEAYIRRIAINPSKIDDYREMN